MADDELISLCAAKIRPHVKSAEVAVDRAIEIVMEVHRRIKNGRELLEDDSEKFNRIERLEEDSRGFR